MSTEQTETNGADVIFAGGGLASCLAALRLSEARPDCTIAIIESGREICGNHTWSFHQTDLSHADYEWITPLIAYRWVGQKVLFPEFERRLSTPYASITSTSLRRAIYACSNIVVRENTKIAELKADQVVLEDETILRAACIIDGRGFTPGEDLKLGFQKFVGLELELAEPHEETVPTIMDACVDQLDGYRFVYVLPLSRTRLLIEDTRYSDGSDLDMNALHIAVLAYAVERGWSVKKTVRSEKGVLPIALAHNAQRFWDTMQQDTAPIGLRAGLFHPTTGYSLPFALRTAEIIADPKHALTTSEMRKAIRAFALRCSAKQSHYRMLNRMLFGAAQPSKRYVVLQRFYRLPQTLIERFYAGRLMSIDKLRILVGKPPVPIQKALGCVSEAKALRKSEEAT